MSKTDNIIDITEMPDRTDSADRTDLSPRVGIYDEAAERLSEAYKEAQKATNDALRKVVVFGLMVIEQQAKLKHGQFLPWLTKHCPEVPQRTAYNWAATAKATIGLLDICHDGKFEDGSLVDVLCMPEEVLIDESAKEVQRKVWELVDGSSAKQLVMGYKSTQESPHQKYNPPKLAQAVSKEEAAKVQRDIADKLAGELILSMKVLQDQVIHLDYDRLEELNDIRVKLGKSILDVMPIAKKRASGGN